MDEIIRTQHVILPDASRVVARPFLPGTTNWGGDPGRVQLTVGRILELTQEDRAARLESARTIGSRHSDVEAIWLRHFETAAARAPLLDTIEDPELQLLIGAYFTQQYAYEAAALTNPSIVPVGPAGPDGAVPFVMSARAIGEGHVSSITFLSGRVARDGTISFDPRSPYATNGSRRAATLVKSEFALKLSEIGIHNEVSALILEELPDHFEAGELEQSLDRVADADIDPSLARSTLVEIHRLATSNYHVEFDTADVTERVISPSAPVESRGMEDARFVRFTGDDGSVTYYATYTAFDGVAILPQLIETTDFVQFEVSTLAGPMASQKGMALFPRKIGGEYVALSRHDQETSFVMRSDHLQVWSNAEVAFSPELGWEAVQSGNCGSPLETDAGWLVITHGVGPMRRYALGAVLLDRDEPTKVLRSLRRPLLEPNREESEGYVPNVLYSCGAMIHNGLLVLPYGFADRGIRVAVGPVHRILDAME